MAKLYFPKEERYRRLSEALVSEQGLDLREESGRLVLSGPKITLTRKNMDKYAGFSEVSVDLARRTWLSLSGVFDYRGRLVKLTEDEMVFSDLPLGPVSVRVRQDTGDILEGLALCLEEQKSKADIIHEALLLYMKEIGVADLPQGQRKKYRKRPEVK